MRLFGPSRFFFMVFVLASFCILMPPAKAYIDPGTGSYLFQIAVGVLLGALVAVRAMWGKIKVWVTMMLSKRER